MTWAPPGARARYPGRRRPALGVCDLGNVIAAGAMEAIGVQRARGAGYRHRASCSAPGSASRPCSFICARPSTAPPARPSRSCSARCSRSPARRSRLILLLSAVVLAVIARALPPAAAQLRERRDGIGTRRSRCGSSACCTCSRSRSRWRSPRSRSGRSSQPHCSSGRPRAALRLTRRPGLAALLTAAGIGHRRHVARHRARLRQLLLAAGRTRAGP